MRTTATAGTGTPAVALVQRLRNIDWTLSRPGNHAKLGYVLLLPAVLMILAIFAKRKTEDSTANAATKSFAKLLVVHWMIQFVIRRAVPWIERRILKRSGDKNPEEIKRIEHVAVVTLGERGDSRVTGKSG